MLSSLVATAANRPRRLSKTKTLTLIIHPVYTSCGPVPSLTLGVMSAHSASQDADSRRKFSEMVVNPPEGEARKLASLMRS